MHPHLLPRLTALSLAVVATVATAATESLELGDSAVETVVLTSEAWAQQRFVRVTVSDGARDADGGFAAKLRLELCVPQATRTRVCSESPPEQVAVFIGDEGEAPATLVPGVLDLDLAALAGANTHDFLVTIGRDPLSELGEDLRVNVTAKATLLFPGLNNGSVIEEGDDIPPNASITVTILPVEAADADDDGLDEAQELALGTDALDPDTDADGVLDGDELALGADPTSNDTDGDGLDDAAERDRGTDPADADTDDDDEADGDEVACGTSPLDPFFVCPDHDTDGDGLADLVEATLGTDVHDDDSDDDTLTDGDEVDRGTSPLDSDSDDDSIADGDEVAQGTSPSAADTDGDGLGDAAELARGTSPTTADTDGDGDGDGAEVACDSSPLDAAFTCDAP